MIRDIYGNKRYTAVEGIRQWEVYGSGRYTAVEGIRQWEVYGNRRYTAVGDKGKKEYLIKSKERADQELSLKLRK
jgi:hypothetical protein